MIATRFATVFVLLAVSTMASAASSDTTPTPIPPGLRITLQRDTGGMEYRTFYIVTVTADGQVHFEGGAFVPTRRAHYRIDAAKLEAIVAAIKQADFNDLRDSYDSPQDACVTYMTDTPVMKITVADTKGSKSVRFTYGCLATTPPTARPRIIQLGRTIDQQLDVHRWLDAPAAPGTTGNP